MKNVTAGPINKESRISKDRAGVFLALGKSKTPAHVLSLIEQQPWLPSTALSISERGQAY